MTYRASVLDIEAAAIIVAAITGAGGQMRKSALVNHLSLCGYARHDIYTMLRGAEDDLIELVPCVAPVSYRVADATCGPPEDGEITPYSVQRLIDSIHHHAARMGHYVED